MKEHYLFINTPLPYGYDALEPYIDEKTMHLHHDKHLQTYIDNLNAALAQHPRLQGLTLEQLVGVSGRLPPEIGTPVARNAGGVYNHRFYFDGLAPVGRTMMETALERSLNQQFGGIPAFKKQMTEAALSVFGSGYAWLVSDRRGRLSIMTTANQDTPLPHGVCPILNIDVWEHAYYLKHYNVRADYIPDWFAVVNWPKANERYRACRQGE